MRIEKVNQQLQSGKILNTSSNSTTDTYSADYINSHMGGAGDGLPIGCIISYPLTTAPEGYLICNGELLNIEDYEDLYNVIGTVYGGNGTTTFKLPDMRDRFIFGYNEGVIGTTGGEATHTLITEEMPSHTHTIKKQVDNNSGTSISVGSGSSSLFYQTTNSVTTNSTGGGQPHNNMPPYITQIFIIKAFNIGEVESSKIVNEYSTSTTNTYSAAYINSHGGSGVSGDNLPIGTEVVLDGNETIPTGWEEVDFEGMIYSTDEQRVGTWIDGNPIYQKTIEYSIVATNTLYTIDCGLNNISHCWIDSASFYYWAGSNHHFPVNFTTGENYIYCYLRQDNKVRFYTTAWNDSNSKLFLTINYIKVTN